jgi:hypothetical protein
MKKTMTFVLLFFIMGITFLTLAAYLAFQLSTQMDGNLKYGFAACGIISATSFSVACLLVT